MGEHPSTHTPVTHDSCAHIEGPFYHGAKSPLEVGAELVPGYGSNFHRGRVSNNIYFTALVETAAWGAELATALAGSGERGRIYVVEPMGRFEDDPNVTNKRFPGNPTQSYRTRDPLRVVAELESWQGHTPGCRPTHPMTTVATLKAWMAIARFRLPVPARWRSQRGARAAQRA